MYHPHTFACNPALIKDECRRWSQNKAWVIQALTSQVSQAAAAAAPERWPRPALHRWQGSVSAAEQGGWTQSHNLKPNPARQA